MDSRVGNRSGFFSWIESMGHNKTSLETHWKSGKNYNIVSHQTAQTQAPAWTTSILFHHVTQSATTLERNLERRFLLKVMSGASILTVSWVGWVGFFTAHSYVSLGVAILQEYEKNQVWNCKFITRDTWNLVKLSGGATTGGNGEGRVCGKD